MPCPPLAKASGSLPETSEARSLRWGWEPGGLRTHPFGCPGATGVRIQPQGASSQHLRSSSHQRGFPRAGLGELSTDGEWSKEVRTREQLNASHLHVAPVNAEAHQAPTRWVRAARTLRAARGAATPSTPSACKPPGIFLGRATPFRLLDPEMCPPRTSVGAPCTQCLCPACPMLPAGSPRTAGDPQGHPARRGGSPVGCPSYRIGTERTVSTKSTLCSRLGESCSQSARQRELHATKEAL